MRIITGSLRGRKLETLSGENTRPTSDRVKEGLFSAIQFQIEGRAVLDLFAGSGQLGLEALSRGAKEAVFVDESRSAVKIIEKNIASCSMQALAKVVCSDYGAFFTRNTKRFDLAFLDPPYQSGLLQKALPLVAACMNEGGTIICEHPLGEVLPERAGSFAKGKTYKYGKILLTFYQRGDVESV